MHSSTLLTSLHDQIAYLDGGSGSMLLQAAIAGVLSASFVVKSQWYRLKAMVARRTHNQPK